MYASLSCMGVHLSACRLFWRFYKYPDKERIEVTKQRDVVYLHNGDKGYELTYKGTAAEDPKLLEEYIRRAEVDPAYYARLHGWCKRLAPRFKPARERSAGQRSRAPSTTEFSCGRTTPWPG